MLLLNSCRFPGQSFVGSEVEIVLWVGKGGAGRYKFGARCIHFDINFESKNPYHQRMLSLRPRLEANSCN
jgi:hypothetical protein